MPYLGNEPGAITDAFTQSFTGDASTVAFTLSQASTTNSVFVRISGVMQRNGTDFDVDGVTLTFTTAPPAGTNNIVVQFFTIGSVQEIAADAVTGAKIADNAIDSEHYTDGSIDTAHIADNQITLAKLAGGTDGNIISFDASGDPVAIATGSSGQVLTSGGAGAAPAFAAAAGGAWNLIGTSEASSSASLTITGIDSTYDTYGVAVSALVPATNNVDFYIRFGDSSGIDSGSSDYAYHASGGRAGAATARTAISGSGQAQIALKLTGDGILNSNGGGFGMMAHILNPSDSTTNTAISGTYQYIASQYDGDGGSFGANHRAIIAHDRIQVLFSSGNIASGRLSVWGLAHA